MSSLNRVWCEQTRSFGEFSTVSSRQIQKRIVLNCLNRVLSIWRKKIRFSRAHEKFVNYIVLSKVRIAAKIVLCRCCCCCSVCISVYKKHDLKLHLYLGIVFSQRTQATSDLSHSIISEILLAWFSTLFSLLLLFFHLWKTFFNDLYC